MPRPSLSSLLERAVDQNIVSADQARRLLELDATSAEPRDEAPGGFNWVNVAYWGGALLVLFACAWFLIKQWENLGPLGVMGVTLLYAAGLVAAQLRLRSLGFERAAEMTLMLAVSLTPLVAWSILRLTGEWPDPNDPVLLHYASGWMATRWVVLELATILVALLVLRVHRSAALMHPISIALFWLWFHTSQTFDLARYSPSYGRWLALAGSFVILAVAEEVERWQRSSDVDRSQRDYAGPFWLVGCVAMSASYFLLWLRLDDWRHLMPFLAIVLAVVALVVRRRSLLVAGAVGVFAYLVYLASEVFRDSGLFPVVLAALGIAMIMVTVWTQRRFPSLVRRFAGVNGGPAPSAHLPWSRGMAWLPAFFCLGMGLIALADAGEERLNAEFRQRLMILRQHSGSLRANSPRPEPPQGDTASGRR